MNYTDWSATMQEIGGRVTTWPFKDNNQGQPAAFFDNATYATLLNAGTFADTQPAGIQPANGGQGMYVLGTAMEGDSVLDGAPTTMTTAQAAENAAFTGLDTVAGAIGVPSLNNIEQDLQAVGKYALIGALVLGAGYLYTHRKG